MRSPKPNPKPQLRKRPKPHSKPNVHKILLKKVKPKPYFTSANIALLHKTFKNAKNQIGRIKSANGSKPKPKPKPIPRPKPKKKYKRRKSAKPRPIKTTTSSTTSTTPITTTIRTTTTTTTMLPSTTSNGFTFLGYTMPDIPWGWHDDQIRKRNSKKDNYIINPRIFNLHPSFITTPVPFHYTTTTPPQISRKVLMDVDFTPIFLALLPLFLTLGTLLGLGLSGTSSSSSTTPSITVSVNNTVGSGTAAGNQFT